jgi:predicted PurR-regulated permease PerM
MTVLTETGWIVGGIVTVAVLTLFLLAAGPPVLARMMATLVGNWHAAKVQSAIEAIRQDVGRYYGTLALINISLGLATAAAMWLLHMPNPILWGAMAAVLNFIPYLGSAVTLLVISVVALVTFDSTAQVLLVAGTYLALATIEGQIVEPIFFGRRLRLSPVVVFVALWLGGWLWGIAGVVFALPLLLAARVAATHAHGEGSVLARFLRSADEEAPPPPEEPPPSRVQIPTMLRARSPRR